MESKRSIKLTEEDLHPHLKARMEQRGVTIHEIQRTLNEGEKAEDVKTGTLGKKMVFPYRAKWEGQFYDEKEVSVYYKIEDEELILLTVKTRYGKDFPRGDKDED